MTPKPVPFFQNGWSGKYHVAAPGGLTLTDLQHEDYHLAKLIRVSRVCINPGAKDKSNSRIFKLGTDMPCLTQDPGGVTLLQRTVSPPYQFATYDTMFGFESAFQTQVVSGDSLFGNDSLPLSVVQRYLFTDYGTEPPHEPSGYLPACRLFPLIQFGTANPAINSVRFDFLLHFSLDSLLTTDALANNSMESISAAAKRPNQAGVFQDVDQISRTNALLGLVASQFTDNLRAITSDFFSAAEKPLQFEILSFALNNGTTTGLTSSVRKFLEKRLGSWDNMHQWGVSDTLPSTPGAFHAAHLHWRWGDLAADPSWSDQIIQQKGIEKGKLTPPLGQGNPVFRGVAAAGGGLVDPNFPNQNILVAITRSKFIPAIDGDTSEFSFRALVTNTVGKTVKQKISDGDDLCAWLSFEVHNPDHKTPFSATVFPHGLFFAHNLENNGLKPTSDTIGQSSPTMPFPAEVPLFRQPGDAYYKL